MMKRVWLQVPVNTNYSSLTPVHTRSKSKGHKVDEPDGGLGSDIAKLRSRDHQRSTSAPIQDRLQTTVPANLMGGAMTNDKVQSKQTDTSGDEKVICQQEHDVILW